MPVITLPQSLIVRDKKVCFEDTFDLEDTDVPGVNAFVDSVKWTDYYFTLNNDGTEAEVQEGGEPLSGLFANTTNPDFGLYTPSDKINDYEEQVYVRLTMTAYAFKPPCDTPQDDVSQSFTLTLTPTRKSLIVKNFGVMLLFVQVKTIFIHPYFLNFLTMIAMNFRRQVQMENGLIAIHQNHHIDQVRKRSMQGNSHFD